MYYGKRLALSEFVYQEGTSGVAVIVHLSSTEHALDTVVGSRDASS